MGAGRPVELTLPEVPSGPTELGLDGPVMVLDLGGTVTRAALVAADGSLHGRVATPTPVDDGPDAVVDAAIAALRRVLEATDSGGRTAPGYPVAMAVSAPGPLDPWSGLIVDPPNLGIGFSDVQLGALLEAALGLPCVVDRDTNVAALGEAIFGGFVGCRDLLYLTVSTGIGGAVITSGRLMMGPDGTAGELGHITVDMDGEPCGCGGRGHLEAISSGTGIARAGARAGMGDVSARDIAVAADGGDERAAAIFRRARAAFAAACVSLVDIFDPDAIVVGGSVARGQGDRWLGEARALVAATAFQQPRRRVRILPATLGDDVGLIGGFVLAAMRAFDDRWRGGRPLPPAVPERKARRWNADLGERRGLMGDGVEEEVTDVPVPMGERPAESLDDEGEEPGAGASDDLTKPGVAAGGTTSFGIAEPQVEDDATPDR